LTDRHEQRIADGERWEVGDAPEQFVAGQLRAIVGVSMTVTRVEAKAKLSQNRSEVDQRGVVDGLAGSPDLGAAEVRGAMLRAQQDH
jgi:transcriptional regulator